MLRTPPALKSPLSPFCLVDRHGGEEDGGERGRAVQGIGAEAEAPHGGDGGVAMS
jgi:hypothetical protein